MNAVIKALNIETNDLVFIVADKNKVVFDSLGALRCEIAKRLGLVDPSNYKLLWITEFPLLEYSEEDGRFYAMHHPFTMPMEEDLGMSTPIPERSARRRMISSSTAMRPAADRSESTTERSSRRCSICSE